MKQLNFNSQKGKLTEKDIDQLVSIIGHRARQKTKSRLYSILKYSAVSLRPFGIYERLLCEVIIDKDNHEREWSYCAGQSYSDEIKTVRNLILGKEI